jgi:cullin 3
MALFRDDVLKSRISKDDPNNPDADHRAVLDLLNRVILDQIQMERDGDVIDKHLIKSCVYMLESLYDDESDSRDQRLYHLSFEREYLAMSRQFYRDEAESLIREADAGAYCRHARRRLYEEQDRCQSTLLESTADKILKVVEEELIKNRIKEVVEMESGVHFMIDNDRLDELNLIYTLEALVDDKKTELTRAIQQRIISLGEEVNSSAIAASTATPAAPETGDKAKGAAQERSINQQTVAAIQWVEDVLQLKDKFDSIWKMSFQQDNVMQTAMTRSFADFINSTNFPRSSEYISLFIDENMKKGIKGKTEMEIDAVLEKAIILLRYVQDKDLFERYYKKHLCRRLLMNKSISNEVEKQMISKMKIELGNNFTMKLEAMFKDMTISEELTCGFKKHVDGLGEKDPRRIELAINVLTSMTWPLETMGSAADDNNNTGGRPNIVFPPAIDRIKRGFEKYYNEKHSGRQLTWLANMGSADLKAVFPRVAQKDGSFKERRHDLNVSTYGMLILLLFNDLSPNASLTFEDIQAQTNIPTSDLIRNLQSLAVAPKTRILLKEPMSKDVKPTDRFSFNEGFSGKFVKIKVGVVASGNKVESDRERRETEKKNDDSRAFCVEAAVVRIMKYVISFPCSSFAPFLPQPR